MPRQRTDGETLKRIDAVHQDIERSTVEGFDDLEPLCEMTCIRAKSGKPCGTRIVPSML